MSKVKKGKAPQMLSPENYIRKKARTLPLFECLIEIDWELTKMTTVVIARSHVNGNITACTYLVDLGCLGVKDSVFLFNISMTKYNEFKETVGSGLGLVQAPYALAHNIVFASVAYAADYGFKPYKEFDSVTKYMLEEDTEDIELIEIECGGTDGNPLYIQGPFEDDTRARQIIAQLEKIAGPDNYTFIKKESDEYLDDYEDEDFEDEHEFDDMTFSEKKELFLTLSKNMPNLEEDEIKRTFYLSYSIVDDLVDVDQYNHFYDQYMDELDIDIELNEVDGQLLGLKPGNQSDYKEWTKRFFNIYQLSAQDRKLANKELIEFKQDTKGSPATYFLELILIKDKDSSQYSKRLKEYAKAFPDYALIQLLWASWQVIREKNLEKITSYPFHLKTFFPGRESIHPIERFYLLMLHGLVAGIEMNINKIDAFGSVIFEFNMVDIELKILVTMVDFLKYNYLVDYLKK